MRQQALSQAIQSVLKCDCPRKLQETGEPVEKNPGLGTGHHLRKQPGEGEEIRAVIDMESGWIGLDFPLNAQDGQLRYSVRLKADYDAAGPGNNPYLDKIDALDLTWYSVRAYTVGMASSAWPQGHSKAGLIAWSGGYEDDHSGQTGKLRLFWQAQHGLAGATPGNLAGMINRPNYGLNDYGLYTTTQGDYYLINVIGEAVYAAPINFTPEGQILHIRIKEQHTGRSQRKNAAHKDFLAKEAYLFSQAETIGAWKYIGAKSTQGTPLYYGWAFDWDGKEAVLITHEQDYVGDELRRVIARRYRLRILETSGNLTATVENMEEKGWRPTNIQEFFFRFDAHPLFARMYSRPWIPCYAQYEGTTQTHEGDPDGVPVIGWMGDSGNPQIIAYSRETISSGGNLTSIINESIEELDESVFTCGGGAAQGTAEKVVTGFRQGFFLRDAGATYGHASKESQSTVSGERYYYQWRKWSASVTHRQGPTCTTYQDLDDNGPGAEGKYCTGEWDWDSLDRGFCGFTERGGAAETGETRGARPTLEQRIYRTEGPSICRNAIIVPANDPECAYLIAHNAVFDGHMHQGKQDWSGIIHLEHWLRKTHGDPWVKVSEAPVRVPKRSFNSYVSTGPSYDWPIPAEGPLMNTVPWGGGVFDFVHDEERGDWSWLRYVRVSKEKAELLREHDLLIDPNQNEISHQIEEYYALFNLVRCGPDPYPYIDYTIHCKRAAIGRQSGETELYHGDLSGGPSKHSSDANLPADLLDKPGLFSGRN